MNQSRERANERTEQEEKTRAKDSAVIFASSSPLFCSVCCLHRPHHLQPLKTHHVAPSPNGMAATSSASGRCHRHTSPPHRQQPAATGQRLDGLQSSPPRPRPLPLPSLPSGGEEGKSKGANETEREGTRAKDAAAIFASSSPLFCSVLCLHRPHHRQPLTISPGHTLAKGTGGHLVRFWSMSSPHLATTSPPSDQQQGSSSTV